MARRSEEGAQFVRYFGPLLDALRELGGSGRPDEVVERIAADLQIPDSVQNELLPSGEPRFRNQVAWARFYLVSDGLVDSSKWGVWSLTEHAGGDAVIDLLQHAAGQAVGVHSKDTQRAKTQVTHGRIGHQLLPILLHQAHQRAIDDADN